MSALGTNRETIPGFLKDLDRRIARQEAHVHHNGANAAITELRAEVVALREEVEMLKQSLASSKTGRDQKDQVI